MLEYKCSRCSGQMRLQKNQILLPFASLNANGTKYLENQTMMVAKVYICEKCFHVELESIPVVP